MSHHFQRKSLISRSLHEKVGLLGYRDLGNGTGNFSYDHAYWVTVNIFFEEKKCKLSIVTAYFLARFEKMLFSDIQRGGGGERGITNAHSGSCALSAKMRAHT